MIKVKGEFMLSCSECGDTWFPKEPTMHELGSEEDTAVVSLGNCRCGNQTRLHFVIEKTTILLPPPDHHGHYEEVAKKLLILKKLKDSFL
jgi:hypothetical protein